MIWHYQDQLLVPDQPALERRLTFSGVQNSEMVPYSMLTWLKKSTTAHHQLDTNANRRDD